MLTLCVRELLTIYTIANKQTSVFLNHLVMATRWDSRFNSYEAGAIGKIVPNGAMIILLTNEMYHCNSVTASSVRYYCNGCSLTTVNGHSSSLRNLERNQFL
ncbi:conserved hypothetical protein [Trichinella spiralis]|uniref:hypothetical protein n=1 Tax=Trichinella spiralis TaxID=6334 RepID=UPI0001EFE179|nr:conserved hypothetical protein [Trichinella spiralis]